MKVEGLGGVGREEGGREEKTHNIQNFKMKN